MEARIVRKPSFHVIGLAGRFTPTSPRIPELWGRLLDAQLEPTAVKELAIGFEPWDVPRDQFIDAPTTWRGLRAGELDPAKVGLSVLGLTGTWFAVGNLMLDAAALDKEEMLPWEKWSVGRDCGPGRELPAEWLEKLDEVAGLLGGSPDAALCQRVYREREWLRVTPTVMSMAGGAPVEVEVR